MYIDSHTIFLSEKKMNEQYERIGLSEELIQSLSESRQAYIDAYTDVLKEDYLDKNVFKWLYVDRDHTHYAPIERIFSQYECSEIDVCEEIENIRTNRKEDINLLLRKAIEYKSILSNFSSTRGYTRNAWHRFLMERRYRADIKNGNRTYEMSVHDDLDVEAKIAEIKRIIEDKCVDEEEVESLKADLEVSFYGLTEIRERILSGETITGKDIADGVIYYRNTMDRVEKATGVDPYAVKVEKTETVKDFLPPKPDYVLKLEKAKKEYERNVAEANRYLWKSQSEKGIFVDDRYLITNVEKGYLKNHFDKIIRANNHRVHEPVELSEEFEEFLLEERRKEKSIDDD